MSWNYGIVYDEPADEFIIAEVYYRKEKPVSYCEADIIGHSLFELELILADLVNKVIKKNYLIYNGKELK